LVYSSFMKTSVILFLWLPLTVIAQSTTESNPPQNATLLLAHFFGEENVQRYIVLDSKKSKQVTPNSFLFHYNFSHPKFSGKTLVITFTLDSAGRFVPTDDMHGLVHIQSSGDSTWISAREALGICRGQARRIKKSSLRLVWDPTDATYDIYKKTHDFRDISPGTLVWTVDGEVLFRGERYKGTFAVNVFTGIVARRFAIPWD